MGITLNEAALIFSIIGCEDPNHPGQRIYPTVDEALKTIFSGNGKKEFLAQRLSARVAKEQEKTYRKQEQETIAPATESIGVPMQLSLAI